MSKLKVTAVSYLNTKPFLYGIFNTGLDQEIDLQLDIPSVCADKLKSGEADLGLVPVAIIPQLSTPHIISDYCIGTVGEVKTVCIYSQVPMNEITHLYLDYHSRTSNALSRILLKEYWKCDPEIILTQRESPTEIKATKAAVVIGDKTIGLDKEYPFIYDLGTAWMDHTGLPFVFAAWVSNRPLKADFIEKLNTALAAGMDHISQLVYLLPSPDSSFDLQTYFTKYISYDLDVAKKKALALFLKKISDKIQPTLATSLSHV